MYKCNIWYGDWFSDVYNYSLYHLWTYIWHQAEKITIVLWSICVPTTGLRWSLLLCLLVSQCCIMLSRELLYVTDLACLALFLHFDTLIVCIGQDLSWSVTQVSAACCATPVYHGAWYGLPLCPPLCRIMLDVQIPDNNGQIMRVLAMDLSKDLRLQLFRPAE
jgi:hypothetical protein